VRSKRKFTAAGGLAGYSILLLHGFALRDEHHWDPSLNVTESLESPWISWPMRGYVVLPLSEGLHAARGHAATSRRAITVDMGHTTLRRRLPGAQASEAYRLRFCVDVHMVDRRSGFRWRLPVFALEGLDAGDSVALPDR